jgi:O-antigen/teichoic acid export membrane protein
MIDKIKSLAKDTAIYGTFRIVGKMLSFLLTPIYTNYILEQSDFAFINFIFPLIAIINVIYSLGLEASFFRFFKSDDTNQSKKAFSNAYVGIAVVSFSITLFIQLFARDIAYEVNILLADKGSASASLDKMTLLIRIAALIPFLDSLLWIPYAYLRMIRKAKRFATVQFSMIVIAVLLNIVFLVVFKLGSLGVLYAQVIATIIGFALLRKEVIGNLIMKLDRTLMKEMLIFGLPVMFANLPAMLLQVFDRILMPYLKVTNAQLNNYSVNYKLGIPMMLIVSMFEYAWKPFFLSHYKDTEAKELFSRVFTYFTMLSVVVFLIVGFFMMFIVRMPFVGGKFINPIYWDGMVIIPIILGGYFFNGAITNFSAGFYITKKTKYIAITMWTAAIANVVLNIYLIPIYGYIGAAWATFVAYLIGALVAYFLNNRVYKLNYEWKRISLLIGFALLCYFPTDYLLKDISNLFVNFAIKCAVLLVFMALLKVFGFFTASELREIKKFFGKRH